MSTSATTPPSVVDLEKENAKLRYREAVLLATSEASTILLRGPELSSAMANALGRIAAAAGMDRLAVLVERPASNGVGLSHHIYAGHTAEGVTTHAELGLTEQRNDHFPTLVAALHAGQPYWLDVDTLPDEGRRNFERLDIQSTAGVPIFVEGSYFGLFAFDYLRSTKPPQPFEIETLKAAAHVVAAAFERERLMEAVRREREAKAHAVLEERNRMAGEIHDSLAQAFTSIAMQSEAALSELPESSPIREPLEMVEETARLGLAEARSAVLALRPVGDALGELEAALESLAARCSIPGTTACRFRTGATRARLSADARSAALRVAQEAVTNALRHARARRVDVVLDVADGQAILRITDDGVGLSADSHGNGLGLDSMRARARSLGGTLAVGRGLDGAGTSVCLTIPADAFAERD